MYKFDAFKHVPQITSQNQERIIDNNKPIVIQTFLCNDIEYVTNVN